MACGGAAPVAEGPLDEPAIEPVADPEQVPPEDPEPIATPEPAEPEAEPFDPEPAPDMAPMARYGRAPSRPDPTPPSRK
ncbi:MAG: hypothetical protein ACI9KE_000122 [Polyangiales bacterium]|jgi:hypothetical protein